MTEGFVGNNTADLLGPELDITVAGTDTKNWTEKYAKELWMRPLTMRIGHPLRRKISMPGRSF